MTAGIADEENLPVHVVAVVEPLPALLAERRLLRDLPDDVHPMQRLSRHKWPEREQAKALDRGRPHLDGLEWDHGLLP